MALTLALAATGIAYVAAVIVGFIDLYRIQSHNLVKDAS